MKYHKDQILNYMLNHPYITPWIAIDKFGCTKLSTRIGELIAWGDNKMKGMKIEKGWIEGKNRNGHKVKVRKYWIK